MSLRQNLLKQLAGDKQPIDDSPRPAASQQNEDQKNCSSVSSEREEGKVLWFDASRGFGSILTENNVKVFVHFRDIEGDDDYSSLKKDQHVAFNILQGWKGIQAVNVSVVDVEARKCKLVFLEGLHPRVGAESSILNMSRFPHYDRKLLNHIFCFFSDGEKKKNKKNKESLGKTQQLAVSKSREK